MTLLDIIDRVRSSEKTLTLFNLPPASSLDTELASFFEDMNVRVDVDETVADAPTFGTLTAPDEFYAAVTGDELRSLLDGPNPGPDGLGIDDTDHEPLLLPLKETTFTSYDSGRMMDVTREIEDRAFRYGTGELHVGFQELSRFTDQTDVYRRLATTDLDIHIYGAPDATVDVDGLQVHASDDEELRLTWFVAFDGGDTPEEKCALLAREGEVEGFYGCWTYDPDVVDRVVEYLSGRYDRVAP
ncbi:DICT sensory domain-containing protein [Haloarchaeobius iranensis]|uniref:Diguanylate Cyclase and Two-component system sensory domain-containing protein n=1 Tax=Haloarchaeobius iranensis TaxID=996166 RepID=A0A1G9WEW2_9EURY|nr:DICT sensory domain-containing protein [Haloarchaeobius iranensis]SDM83092.1 Diguanylate Cyclase and Two-component system sensory domain-containing protein [Haloarchaeobius iranensis]